MAQDGGEGTVAVRDLKDRGVSETLVLSEDLDQPKDRLDWTQQVVIRRRQRDLVDTFAELVIFRFLHGDNDTVVDVVVKWSDVLPAQNHLQIDRVYRPGN